MVLSSLIGVILGFFLKPIEERWFGAKLKIDCEQAPAHTDKTEDKLYVRFRVVNTTERRIAKQCRAYVTGLYKIADGKVVGSNLLHDSFQLPWAGHDFTPRDIPAGIAQYANLVQFSKDSPGQWNIFTMPRLYSTLQHLTQYKGTYRFKVVVAGENTRRAATEINVEYPNNGWDNILVYDS